MEKLLDFTLRKYSTFLLLSLTLLFAQQPTIISKQERKQILLLQNILHKVQNYKMRKEQEIAILKRKLHNQEKKFQKYKIAKDKELRYLQSSLKSTQQELHKSKKQVAELEKILHRLSGDSREFYSEEAIEKEFTYLSNNIANATVFTLKNDMPPLPTDLEWIEITVDQDISIYDLALKYYGNSQNYQEIYNANRHIIREDLKLYNGMQLMIPMTENFREQPILLYTQ